MAKKKVTFAGAMSKVNPKAWAKARTAEPGGSDFTKVPEIEDGVYPCKVTTAKADTDGKGVPYCAFGLVVLEGKYEGTKLDKFHSIKEQEKDLERLVKTIKGMGYQMDDNADAGSFIEGVVEDINDKDTDQPEVLVKVENRTYTADKGKNAGKEVKALNVYINRPLSAEDGVGTAAKPAKAKGAATKKAAPKKKARR